MTTGEGIINIFRMLLSVLVFCCVSGCQSGHQNPRSDDFYGVYTLSYKSVKSTVNLKSDQTFSQTVVYTDGKMYKFVGKYRIDDSSLSVFIDGIWNIIDERGNLNPIGKPKNTVFMSLMSLPNGKFLIVNPELEVRYQKTG